MKGDGDNAVSVMASAAFGSCLSEEGAASSALLSGQGALHAGEQHGGQFWLAAIEELYALRRGRFSLGQHKGSEAAPSSWYNDMMRIRFCFKVGEKSSLVWACSATALKAGRCGQVAPRGRKCGHLHGQNNFRHRRRHSMALAYAARL